MWDKYWRIYPEFAKKKQKKQGLVVIQGLKNFPKVHWSRTREHQESTGPEKCSTGPEYRNGGNKIC
jgi:hypothetical protein